MVFVAFVVAMWLYVDFGCGLEKPNVRQTSLKKESAVVDGDYIRLGGNWLRNNRDGLWEMYVEGDATDRGAAFGILCDSLIYAQEKAFVDQMFEVLPSDFYRSVLLRVTKFFNRHITEYIPEENKAEIYSMSLSCSPDFDFVASPYERQIQFHAAHDIGHAMQDYMLVGCTSFAAWNGESDDGELIVARNFDFFVGEDFAKNKLVSFFKTDRGYSFAMVGWAGMTGVVSGMNTEGLTVTINAAKGDMPGSSALPISLLARQILQYATTIDEAYEIAKKNKTFVSESLLIGSGKENKASIIEKTVSNTVLYDADGSNVISTNHFQSKELGEHKNNQEYIKTSDSPYRFKRVQELLYSSGKLTPEKAVSILRDTKGLSGTDIGLGNEKSINQLIAHHSVVFKPASKQMWVSTSPWQLGEFVAYDLDLIFSENSKVSPVVDSLLIMQDSLLCSDKFKDYISYINLKKQIESNEEINVVTDSVLNKFISLNPEYFKVYEFVGDVLLKQGRKKDAVSFWERALHKEIPKKKDVDVILEKIRSNKR